MQLLILGIGGTLMTGVALLAKEMGYTVWGYDKNTLYPPMSTALENAAIPLLTLTEAAEALPKMDMVIVGNVMSRGHALVEQLLTTKLPFYSAPEWLQRFILHKRKLILVTGTHGKTTTASLLAHILNEAGYNPGFLIGGIPLNFGISARLGSAYFVLEADEYDSAFFDKRPKMMHYYPQQCIITNIDFDHIDIYNNLGEIQQQFHYLLRHLPPQAHCIYDQENSETQAVLQKGLWSQAAPFSLTQNSNALWAKIHNEEASSFSVHQNDSCLGTISSPLCGSHQVKNALAAIQAALFCGLSFTAIQKAFPRFLNVARRLEQKGEYAGIRVIEDFAHHPLALRETLNAYRARVGAEKRIHVALDFASHTMRSGHHGATIIEALQAAHSIALYDSGNLQFDTQALKASSHIPTQCFTDIPSLLNALLTSSQSGDDILLFSNGSFGGLCAKLTEALAQSAKRRA